MEEDAPDTEAEILRRTARILAEHLPAQWSTQLTLEPSPRSRIDAQIAGIDPGHVGEAEGDPGSMALYARCAAAKVRSHA